MQKKRAGFADDSGWMYIAIVGVVALVAIVVMILSQEGPASLGSTDAYGQAIGKKTPPPPKVEKVCKYDKDRNNDGKDDQFQDCILDKDKDGKDDTTAIPCQSTNDCKPHAKSSKGGMAADGSRDADNKCRNAVQCVLTN